MQSRRDSSVLRSLALSFGEGLAFSVGAKLVGNHIDAPDFAPVAARLEQIERRIATVERPREPMQFDQKVIHAIVSALEIRIQEQSAHVGGKLDEQASSLRTEVQEMHREFAATVANVVGELEARMQDRVAAAVAPLQAEVADLRARMAETENTMAEFVAAISLMCRKAAERNEPQADPEPESEPSPAVAEPVLDLPIPAFAQSRKTPGIWRIPVASSFLFAFAAAALLMRAL